MKILLAKTAGFCMGVRRAMQTVLDEIRRARRPVFTQGPLIHNPQVVRVLEGKGVHVWDSSGPPPEGTVVIRAHGAVPGEKQRLEACGCRVVDATCPHVLRIQGLIGRHVRAGEEILIVGDAGHPEVDGLLGHAMGHGHVVAAEADVAALPQFERVCVVSQTTQSHEQFERVACRARARWPDCAVHRTICDSTHRRQAETEAIAARADAMIVVGGRNSANTVRLAQLAAATGTPTQHVETADEIAFDRLRGARIIGLTAGASTPNWMIADVEERLREFTARDWIWPLRLAHGALQLALDTNVYLAVAAVAAASACAAMERIALTRTGAMIAFLYVFAMHSFNLFYERQAPRLGTTRRHRFHARWDGVLIPVGIASLSLAIMLSSQLSLWGVAVISLACVAGVFYRLRIVPDFLQPLFGYRRLIDIPGSKDLFAGLAWAFVLALLPVMPATGDEALVLSPVSLLTSPGVAVAFAFVFVLAFVRSVVFDLRDVQGDQIMGRETIPIALGNAHSYALLTALVVGLFVLMMTAPALGLLGPIGYLMALPVLYTGVCLYLFHRGAIRPHGIVFEALLGLEFLLAGALALLDAWLG